MSKHNEISSFIWNVCDDVLRGLFKQHEYGDVIIPFLVLRRLDCVLDGKKDEIIKVHQEYKDKFDKIDSLYKYVNVGTIIGYSKDLYNMACECIQFLEKSNGRDRGNDQGIIGKYIYEHMDDSKLILLDTNCEIFWVTSNDNDNLLKYGTHNVNTNTRPLILRVAVDGRESSELYKNTCNIIINA